MERNPGYFGYFRSNIQQFEWRIYRDPQEGVQAYRENRIDATVIPAYYKSDDLPQAETKDSQRLLVGMFVFATCIPPLDDLRVRKAFGLTIDRQELFETCKIPILRGGLVPPGMPGHSPDIGLPFNVELGRKLLADAGYPGGRGFPELIALSLHPFLFAIDELARQWRDNLGIEVNFKSIDPTIRSSLSIDRITYPLNMMSWMADYPDPDIFLRQSDVIYNLRSWDWQDADYNRLVDEAARTPDRGKRMAMYRQADRRLVEEQVLVLPLWYGAGRGKSLVKPWIKNYQVNLLGQGMYDEIIIEKH
jgi:oligopeptide transport system substrate-binding protein